MSKKEKNDTMPRLPDERHDLPSRFAVFSAKNGRPDVVARFENDDVWLTQEHLAHLYGTTKQNVSQHLKSIFASGELDEATKVKRFFTMGKKAGQVAERPIYHYCLDVIIALGYRIDSPVAIRFRPKKAEAEFEIYRAREMRQLKSDFDKAVAGYLRKDEQE